eukprot:TRINITY_DN58817_c0_g1_i1.p1 TRINITY_DN58817_c0_g1~~TRINITY_DN58817_c0_g1_i1.p1  ORF type:complete len:385 (+),score=2.79 TRINITY_DN58817_c0_g1_i1:66-1157(+)
MAGLAVSLRVSSSSSCLSRETLGRSAPRVDRPGVALSRRCTRDAGLTLRFAPSCPQRTAFPRRAVTAAQAKDDGASPAESDMALLPSTPRPDNWVSPVLLEQLREDDDDTSPLQKWLSPPADELPDDVPMSLWDHLEELRERVLVSVGAVGAAILLCFFFAKDLVVFLEAPVYAQGVRFLQLSPGEYFFTTLKVAGYCGLLLGGPVILYEIVAFVVPGLTVSERKFLAPIVFGSSVLFYTGISFSYYVLTPAALNFFISYAEGVVESLWSIDQYFEFVLLLMFSTGLSFQVPVIQLLLGQLGLVTSEQMLSIWRYVVVGAVAAAAVLTPSTDPLTQCLLAGPLIGLYMGGAYLVKLVEGSKAS